MYCQCGCGQETSISLITTARYGYIKGEPYRFVQGHYSKGTPEQRFWTRVAKNGPLWNDTPCWLWTVSGSLLGDTTSNAVVRSWAATIHKQMGIQWVKDGDSTRISIYISPFRIFKRFIVVSKRLAGTFSRMSRACHGGSGCFYAENPCGGRIGFVEEGTMFTGSE